MLYSLLSNNNKYGYDISELGYFFCWNHIFSYGSFSSINFLALYQISLYPKQVHHVYLIMEENGQESRWSDFIHPQYEKDTV